MRIVLLNTIGEACGGFVETSTVLKYKWKRTSVSSIGLVWD